MFVSTQKETVTVKKPIALPNTAGSPTIIQPGTYVAKQDEHSSPGEHHLYKADASGNEVGEPIATVVLTTGEDGVMIAS